MSRPARNLNRAFGEALRVLRTEAGLSQEALGHESDLHRTYISMLERGEKSPSLDSIVALAEALGVRPHELVKAAEESRR